MRAIEFSLGATKLLDIRYGESQFKIIDEFWCDFKPDGGEKTTSFLPCICKDTPENRELVGRIQDIYKQIKDYTDARERDILQIRNKIVRK